MSKSDEKQSFGSIALGCLCAGLGFLLMTKGIGVKGGLGGGLGALVGAFIGSGLYKLFAEKKEPPAPRIPATKAEHAELRDSLRARLERGGKDDK